MVERARRCNNCYWGQWIKDKYLALKAVKICETCVNFDKWETQNVPYEK